MAETTNLLLLLAEGTVYFAVMAALFRVRHRFGIGTFFCALGTMHFLETYLAAILYVQVAPEITVSPGSVVLFSGKLVMLLLVYIREDAAAVRQPIYGLLLGNFLMVGMVMLLRHHIVFPATERWPDFAFIDQMGGLMVWGTILLFIDSILIILIYERSAAWLGARRQTARIVLSAAMVLTFDQIGFFLALHLFVGVPMSVLWGGWVAKLAAALFYGVLTGAYLRWMEAKAGHVARPRLSDVFDTLTYRQRYEALLRRSGYDGLTGVLDRGRFEDEGRRAVAQAVAVSRAVSLLVIDIDHFKDFNDLHGHAVGDEVLRRIAAGIQEAVREDDLVFRYGGEEFVVICDGLAYASAMVAAERLRRKIATTVVTGVDRGVSASIGIATSPDDGRDLDSLFAAADARLYAAKAEGRDRIIGRQAPAAQGKDGLPQARRPA